MKVLFVCLDKEVDKPVFYQSITAAHILSTLSLSEVARRTILAILAQSLDDFGMVVTPSFEAVTSPWMHEKVIGYGRKARYPEYFMAPDATEKDVHTLMQLAHGTSITWYLLDDQAGLIQGAAVYEKARTTT